MVAVTAATVPAMLLEVAGAPVVVVATVLVLVPAMLAVVAGAPVATVTTVVVAGVPRCLLENHPSSGASSAARLLDHQGQSG